MLHFECRLRIILATIPIKQKQLLEDIQELGHEISPAALSKLVNNKTNPEFITAFVVAKALRKYRPQTRIEDVWVEASSKN